MHARARSEPPFSPGRALLIAYSLEACQSVRTNLLLADVIKSACYDNIQHGLCEFYVEDLMLPQVAVPDRIFVTAHSPNMEPPVVEILLRKNMDQYYRTVVKAKFKKSGSLQNTILTMAAKGIEPISSTPFHLKHRDSRRSDNIRAIP